MEHIKDYGILTSITWNSVDWAGEPTREDLANSNYAYVKENQHAHESLNFGHDVYPAEPDGTYIGYTPMFRRTPSAHRSEDIRIIFLASTDYHDGIKKIVGCYGFPYIDDFDREAKHPLFKKYDTGNFASATKDIVYFSNPISIDNNIAATASYLPTGVKLSQQRFNYLDSDNVYNVLREAHRLNQDDKRLTHLIKRLAISSSFDKEVRAWIAAQEIIGQRQADGLKDIAAIEDKMTGKTPDVKYRMSKYIERGVISQQIKKINGYRCQVCEQLGMDPIGFIKTDGIPYVESHHVDAVSSGKKGVLSAANIITVCANHHRQLHYSNATLLSNHEDHFIFVIEKKEIKVNKCIIK